MEKFDVIIVGAGPAGSACAYYLAKEGYNVLLLDKAKVPGQRNMTGGVLYGAYEKGYGLIDLIPDFQEEAPLERKIVEHSVFIISDPLEKDDRLSYKCKKLDESSLLSKLRLIYIEKGTGYDYSVLRAKFDKWFAFKAMKEGAMLSTESTCIDLIKRENKIIGVLTNREELYADLIVDASGVTSKLVEKAGLRGKLKPEDVYHGVKHVYSLDPKIMEEKFKLKEKQGVAWFYFGQFMKGVKGGAFLYTNYDTLSIGIVISLDSFLKKSLEEPYEIGKPLEILEALENHPILSNYLEGAKLVEYSAHNIPKGYRCMLNEPYKDGFLVAGDALGTFVKLGNLIDGMRRAIASGIMAAQTYIKAKKLKDFSSKTLSLYRELLAPIYRDIKRSKRDSRISESNFAYNLFPKLIFTLGMAKRYQAPKEKIYEPKDSLQKIQDRTSLLDYYEDKEYSHIKVNYELASKSKHKPWIPACPTNCYTLVLNKGVYASYRDLYEFNLKTLESKLKGKELRIEALKVTKEDIAKGELRFDHIACVACGTCGVIGPEEQILFDHELDGHGVKYKYG
ncbi:MAG: FAD-dependent oxidoreductase [Nitrososphaerales archaeon]